MENFINDRIDIASLPKFEEVALTPLQPAYKKIMLFNIAVVFILAAIGIVVLLYFAEPLRVYWYLPVAGYAVVLAFALFIAHISFKNRGFAFRSHDVIYRSGAIAITTTIVPYNRVQHVAVHEGWLSRKLGLASVELFTAGGNGSDINIHGIDKAQAGKIKALMMGKIQNEEVNEA